MTEKLLPCPFCGGGDLRVGGDDKWVGAVCLSCGAVGPDQYGSSNDWNRRTPAPEGEAVGDPVLWKDRPDEWTDDILAVHPVNSTDPERHNRFTLAMKMVGNRHGKYELVGLVHWLLTRLDEASPVVPVGVSREDIANWICETPCRPGCLSWQGAASRNRCDCDRDAILAALRPTDTGREG